ncbi:TIGR02147 family protein [bacterium]|nr:TIGR02147 family protein [bacterium]
MIPNTPSLKCDIFRYSDYRSYLRDFISLKKASGKGFSVRQFCLKAGITTENYLNRILRKQRNIGPRTAERLIDVMKLNREEKNFFITLVLKESAKTVESKSFYLEKISAVQRRKKIPDRITDNSMMRNWYTVVIWELATCKDFDLTIENIIRSLRKPISPAQAREALKYLVEKGFLKQVDGRWRQSEKAYTTTNEIEDPLVQMNHKMAFESAIESINGPLAERGMYGLTIAINRNRIPTLKKHLDRFIDELNAEFAYDKSSDVVLRAGAFCFIQAETPKC